MLDKVYQYALYSYLRLNNFMEVIMTIRQIITAVVAKEKELGIYDSGFKSFLSGYGDYKEYLEWLRLSIDNTRIDGHNNF